jgi:hypothetical protein
VRNPWGAEKYSAAWSDMDERWTEDLLQKADHTLDNDGKFHMEFEAYVNQMEYTDFNLNTEGK